jgi:hypothetical protein
MSLTRGESALPEDLSKFIISKASFCSLNLITPRPPLFLVCTPISKLPLVVFYQHHHHVTNSDIYIYQSDLRYQLVF